MRFKMSAVFMISTSTLAIRTGIVARWIAFLSYAFALFLLLSGRYIEWILMLFPLWGRYARTTVKAVSPGTTSLTIRRKAIRSRSDPDSHSCHSLDSP